MTAGGGHQTSTSGRWGDYSALSIDPSDNATFWHTHEYYSATSSASWNTRIGNFRFPPTAPVATGVVSRKTHGAAGDFDINLPTTGTPGIESRSGLVAGEHQIIVTFANTVTVSAATVSSGTGNVNNFSVSGGQVTVNLTGVADAQRLTVTLNNVNDGVLSGDVAVTMAVLLGDTNFNGTVNASDIGQTKAQSGQLLTSSNFREDVNTNGSINATDVALVKSRSGNSLPP